MPTSKIRVAICGGGISGLCLAVALTKYPGIQVDVYEAAQQFKEIGAGVMIWSRTWKILDLLGLSSDFSHRADVPPVNSLDVGFDYRRSDLSEGFHFYTMKIPYGCIRFHRAHFLDVFVNHLPQDTAHFGKRLMSYSAMSAKGPLVLKFHDETEVECDLLIGCDGIKSTIRGQLLTEEAAKGHPELSTLIEPRWSGTIAYRGLIPAENILAQHGGPPRTMEMPMMYCGKNKHVVSYPISGGSIINVITFSSQMLQEGTSYEGPWVEDCSQDELLDCYAGWETEVVDLLKCIKKPTHWALHELHPLPFYVSGRVALVGDAAHAMLPHQGAGAGQAIEDAYILAAVLGHASSTDKPDLCAALRAYEKIRIPIANAILTGSSDSGKMYEFNSKFEDDYDVLGPAIQKQWDWITSTSPEEDARRAISILRVAG